MVCLSAETTAKLKETIERFAMKNLGYDAMKAEEWAEAAVDIISRIECDEGGSG